LNDTGQLSASLVHAIAIDRVNDKDQALSAREVVSPQRTDLVLTTDVPDVELGVFVGDGLDVEADGGDCCYILVQLEFVEDGCLARRVSTLRTGCKQNGGWILTRLASSVETKHQQAHFLAAEDLGHHL
jgi:hypothetical protein